MLALPPSVKIFVATEPVDARKSFNGLSCVVREALGGDPQDGHMYVFINRRGDVIQILFWDRTGFAIMRKRLEAGTFRLAREADGHVSHVEIDVGALWLMLEGIDVGSARRRKRYVSEAQLQTIQNQQ
jgi:transposase